MRVPASASRQIPGVRYEAPAGYDLDLELLSLPEFRRRVSAAHLRRPQRIHFHVLLFVTEGRCVHTVDFESFACQPGTLLWLTPGQVQQFDARSTRWDGWMVLVRPEVIPARASGVRDAPGSLPELSQHRTLGGAERQAVAEALERMANDVRVHRGAPALRALLRHQLLALLLRLSVLEGEVRAESTSAPAVMRRFNRYRTAVEREFARLHRVADYAKLIGCSQKSLQRASLSVAGISAKTYLSQRVVLEAKRLLVHTDQPVAVISAELGFEEVSNFVKFFRRLSGTVPGEFRRAHAPR